MGYKLVTAPAMEPLSLPEAKNHLRLDVNDDDTLIGLLITAARQYAEQKTGRSFCTQSWAYILDSFPGALSYPAVPFGSEFSLPASAILLEKGPVASVDSIQYLDMTGTLQTLSSTVYTADLTGTLTRITPKFGKIWPPVLPQIAAVTVNFTAGYGLAADVPQGIKQWLLLRIGALYENREDVVVNGRSIAVTPMSFVDSLLDPYNIVRA